jgi:hypothetical protein
MSRLEPLRNARIRQVAAAVVARFRCRLLGRCWWWTGHVRSRLSTFGRRVRRVGAHRWGSCLMPGVVA